MRFGERRVLVEPELQVLGHALVGPGLEDLGPRIRTNAKLWKTKTRDPTAMPTGKLRSCEFRKPQTSV
jgi:hypothetical protein